MPASKNLEYKKTSFLNKSNNAFIEQMYVKFINKDPSLPRGPGAGRRTPNFVAPFYSDR